MRTALHRARGLGSAKTGTEHFWAIRLTAVASLVAIALSLAVAVALAGASHRSAVAVLSSPPVSVLLLALLASVLPHMRLGMQVIIEDYVHGELLKLCLLMANTFFVWALGFAGALAVLKLALGG